MLPGHRFQTADLPSETGWNLPGPPAVQTATIERIPKPGREHPVSHVIRRIWLLPALAFGFVFLSVPPATASCAEPVPIEQSLGEAPTVFVGTVTHVQYSGRVATFQVEEVWKGDVGVVAVVNGGPGLSELEAARAQGQEVFTSVDRTFESGSRYLVVSYARDGALLSDNACSATRAFTADLEQHRPDSAYAPVAAAAPDTGDEGVPPGIWIGLAALVVATAAMVVAIRRLRMRPTHPRAS